MNSPSHLFVFGRTPKLAFAELASFFPSAEFLSEESAVVAADVDEAAMSRSLGGTVKIASIEEISDTFTPQDAARVLLHSASGGKLVYGISIYGASLPAAFLRSVKDVLATHAISARFVEPKHGSALGSVVVEKQDVLELIAVYVRERIYIAKTRAVQPFEEWNKRDYARPASDPKRGMLPPKVARMIVNISLPRPPAGQGKPSNIPIVLDPYCGMGTVLMEALLSGARVAGGDISQDAVAKAAKNLSWARAEYGFLDTPEPDLYTGDATHVSEHFGPESVDAIATEPFMGEPVKIPEGERFPAHKAKNILKGLEKLYTGSLREWHSVLKPGSRVVMAMPAYETDQGVMRVKNVVDRCENLGYTRSIGPLEYSRPQAIVRREFFVFEKI